MKIDLQHPIERDGVTIASARIFAPRAEDMRAIAQVEDGPAGDVLASIATISRLTDLPIWAVEMLRHEDLIAVGVAADAMFAERGRH